MDGFKTKNISQTEGGASGGRWSGLDRYPLQVAIVSAGGLPDAVFDFSSGPYCSLEIEGRSGIKARTKLLGHRDTEGLFHAEVTASPVWNSIHELPSYTLGQALVFKVNVFKVKSHDREGLLCLGGAVLPAVNCQTCGGTLLELPLCSDVTGEALDPPAFLRVSVRSAAGKEAASQMSSSQGLSAKYRQSWEGWGQEDPRKLQQRRSFSASSGAAVDAESAHAQGDSMQMQPRSGADSMQIQSSMDALDDSDNLDDSVASAALRRLTPRQVLEIIT